MATRATAAARGFGSIRPSRAQATTPGRGSARAARARGKGGKFKGKGGMDGKIGKGCQP